MKICGECQGKNKNKNYLIGVFYQPRPEDKEKLIWIQKLDTILSAITTTWNKTIVIAGDTNIDYNKPSTVLETYKEVLDTYNLKQHVKKPTRQGVKTIDHIVSNLETEKVLMTDVLLCPTVSDHDVPYAIIKIPTALFQTRYKYIKNMKNFNTKEYYTDFSTLLFSTVYSFDNPDNQLAMLNKLILDCIDHHAPLKRTKFTIPPAPWMKLDIIELEKQRDKYRFLAHNIPSKENWRNFRNASNKLKKKIKDTKTEFYKKILTSKNSKEIWKIVHRILSPSDKTLEADTNELNQYFNETGKRLTTIKPHSNDELKNLMKMLSNV